MVKRWWAWCPTMQQPSMSGNALWVEGVVCFFSPALALANSRDLWAHVCRRRQNAHCYAVLWCGMSSCVKRLASHVSEEAVCWLSTSPVGSCMLGKSCLMGGTWHLTKLGSIVEKNWINESIFPTSMNVCKWAIYTVILGNVSTRKTHNNHRPDKYDHLLMMHPFSFLFNSFVYP